MRQAGAARAAALVRLDFGQSLYNEVSKALGPDFKGGHTKTIGLAPSIISWLKSLPSYFDAQGLEITQHQVKSKDGTRVPYFQVSRKGLKLDGRNPTLLYGYGGFNVPTTSIFSPTSRSASDLLRFRLRVQ